MYSQLCLPHSIVVYCASITTRVLQVFSQKWGCTSNRMVRVCNSKYIHTQAGNTTGKSGVAAETVELVLQFLRCFPIQDSVYSSFTLFEDQALKLLWGSNVVLSCSGLGPRFLAL